MASPTRITAMRDVTLVNISGGLPGDGPGRDDKLVIRHWNGDGVCDEVVVAFDYDTGPAADARRVKATVEPMLQADWYVMHDHGPGTERHIHSTAQHHSGDVKNPRANDHTGVATVPTLDEARFLANSAAANDTPPASSGKSDGTD